MPMRSRRKQAGVLIQEPHHHRFAILARKGEIRTSTGAANLDVEAPVLGAGVFGNVEARDKFQAQGHGTGDLGIGFGLDVEHAVDAEADAQPFSWGSKWMSRPQAHRSSNTVWRSLTTGASSAPGQSQQVAEFHRNVAQFRGQFLLPRPVICSPR